MKFAILLFGLSAAMYAQLAAPNASGVTMGHLHLYSKDPEAQRKLWADVLGAQESKLGNMQVFKLPGVLILLQKADPRAGSEGSVINHLGFKVRDLSATLAKVEAAHITIVSRTPPQAMLLAPDDIRVELTEDPSISAPAIHHHIHFYATDVEAMQKWYATTFGAIPGKRGKFDADDLPGVNLSFTPFAAAQAPTKGRALDHIGFEVENLEAFTKKLEAAGVTFDVPYRKIPALGLSLAFLTDPWGTYIELTEGLNKL
ncbi:MAG: VOC family protein [Bryobacteraceae bacterium]|jgi:catechol 2,3-dioxygenase-like lactoylglutathione lyase family enzyme